MLKPEIAITWTKPYQFVTVQYGKCTEFSCRFFFVICVYIFYIHIICILYTPCIHLIYISYTSCIHFIYILYTSYILFIYILYTSCIHFTYFLGHFFKTFWTCSGQVLGVKKHFFPELSGDLWGVICYHHWYPRAGLEGRENSYFSKKVLSLKKMQNYPLSIFHVAVRPES